MGLAPSEGLAWVYLYPGISMAISTEIKKRWRARVYDPACKCVVARVLPIGLHYSGRARTRITSCAFRARLKQEGNGIGTLLNNTI
jgi:hypothetical protein